LLRDVFRGFRPDAVGVLVVRAPHYRLDADVADQLGADRVELKQNIQPANGVWLLHREETMSSSQAITRRANMIVGVLAPLGLFISSVPLASADKPSTPATVTNPATSPALTSNVDDPGRVPYQNQVILDCTGPAAPACSTGQQSVPPGKRLVVQHVAVAAEFKGSATAARSSIAVFAGGLLSAFPLSLALGGTLAIGDQPVQFYVNGGGSFIGFVSADFTPGLSAEMTLTGYLLDCTVNQCTPIAP
jgi:hypothetical protein